MTEYLTKEHLPGGYGEQNESINIRLSRAINSNHTSRTYLNFYDPINQKDSSP
jgi:hypothetical protein